MKKILSLILAGLMMTAVLAACGGESEDTPADTTTEASVTTTASATTTKATESEPATNEPATNEPATNEPATSEPATNEPATNEPATNEPATNEPATNEPATNEPAQNASLTWYDNNGDQGVFYEITDGENGAVNVVYTMQTAAEAEATNGYPGWSWVNMAADVSEVYDGQTKFVMKIKGEAGDVIWIKPFDDQAFEQTITLDGSEQTLTFELGTAQPEKLVIIIFGGGAKPDTAGEFTILDAYFE